MKTVALSRRSLLLGRTTALRPTAHGLWLGILLQAIVSLLTVSAQASTLTRWNPLVCYYVDPDTAELEQYRADVVTLSPGQSIYCSVPGKTLVGLEFTTAQAESEELGEQYETAQNTIQVERVFIRTDTIGKQKAEARLPATITWLESGFGVITADLSSTTFAITSAPDAKTLLRFRLYQEARIAQPLDADSTLQRILTRIKDSDLAEFAAELLAPKPDFKLSEALRYRLFPVPAVVALLDNAPAATEAARAYLSVAAPLAALWLGVENDSGLVQSASYPPATESSATLNGQQWSLAGRNLECVVKGPALLKVESRFIYQPQKQSQFQRYSMTVTSDAVTLASWLVSAAPDRTETEPGKLGALRDEQGRILGRTDVHYVLLGPRSYTLRVKANRDVFLRAAVLVQDRYLFRDQPGEKQLQQALEQSRTPSLEPTNDGERLALAYIQSSSLLVNHQVKQALDVCTAAETTIAASTPEAALILAALRLNTATAYRLLGDPSSAITTLLASKENLSTLDATALTPLSGALHRLVVAETLVSLVQDHSNNLNLIALKRMVPQALAAAATFPWLKVTLAEILATCADDSDSLGQAIDFYVEELARDPDNRAVARGYWDIRYRGTWQTVTPKRLFPGSMSRLLDPIVPVSSKIDTLDQLNELTALEPEFSSNGVWFELQPQLPVTTVVLPQDTAYPADPCWQQTKFTILGQALATQELSVSIDGDEPTTLGIEPLPKSPQESLGFTSLVSLPCGQHTVKVAWPDPAWRVFTNLPHRLTNQAYSLRDYLTCNPEPESALIYRWESMNSTSIRVLVRRNSAVKDSSERRLFLCLDGQQEFPVTLILPQTPRSDELPAVFYLDIPRGNHQLTIRADAEQPALLVSAALRVWQPATGDSCGVPSESEHGDPDSAPTMVSHPIGFAARWFGAVGTPTPQTLAELESVSRKLATRKSLDLELAPHLLLRARSLLLAQRPDLALHDLRAAAALPVTEPKLRAEIMAEYAATVAASGSNSEAKAVFEQIGEDALDPESLLDYCWWLLDQGESSRAADLLLEQLGSPGSSGWTTFALARALAGLGSVDEAIALLSSIPQSDQAYELAQWMYAALLLNLGNIVAVDRELDTILQRATDDRLRARTALLKQDLQDLLASDLAARPEVRTAILTQNGQVNEADSAALHIGQFNKLWFVRSLFPKFTTVDSTAILTHGDTVKIASVDAAKFGTTYYTISPLTPFECTVEGPTALSVSVRPEHPLTIEGDAAPFQTLHLRLTGVEGGCVQASFPENPPASDSMIVEYKRIIPGVREEVILPVAAGPQQIKIEALQGRGFIVVRTQQVGILDSVIGGDAGLRCKASWQTPAASILQESLGSQTISLDSTGSKVAAGGSRTVSELMSQAWRLRSEGERSNEPWRNHFTGATALARKALELVPDYEAAAALVDQLSSRLERRALLGSKGAGYATLCTDLAETLTVAAKVRNALNPAIDLVAGSPTLLLHPWDSATVSAVLSRETRVKLKLEGHSPLPYLPFADRVRGAWRVDILHNSELVASSSGSHGESAIVDLGLVQPGNHEITLRRSRMASTIPVKVYLLTDHPGLDLATDYDQESGFYKVKASAKSRYNILQRNHLETKVFGPTTLSLDLRVLNLTPTSPDSSQINLTISTPASHIARTVTIPNVIAGGARLETQNPAPIAVSESTALDIPISEPGLATVTIAGVEPAQLLAARMWAERDRTLALEPLAVSLEAAEELHLWSGSQPWTRSLDLIATPDPAWRATLGLLEVETTYHSRQSEGDDGDASGLPTDFLETGLSQRRFWSKAKVYTTTKLITALSLADSAKPLLGLTAALNANKLPLKLRARFGIEGYTQRIDGEHKTAGRLALDLRRSFRTGLRFLVVPGIGLRARFFAGTSDDWQDRARPDLRIFSRYSEDHPAEGILQTLVKYEAFRDLFLYSRIQVNSGGESDSQVFSNWRTYSGVKGLVRKLLWDVEIRTVAAFPEANDPIGLEPLRIKATLEYYRGIGSVGTLAALVEEQYYPDSQNNSLALGIKLFVNHDVTLRDLDPHSMDFETELFLSKEER